MDLIYENWLDAQNSVIGSILISPELTPKVLSQVSDADFSGKTLMVLQAIRSLFTAHAPIDVVTVRDKLGAEYTKYLMQLMEITPTAVNWQCYVDLCKKQARILKLQTLGARLASADTPEEQQAILSEAVNVNSARQGIKSITFREALEAFMDRHSSGVNPEYLNWPIREMNDLIFAEKGDFILLAGAPSAGKTAFALQCAWTLAKTLRVGFFSLETGEKKLTDRQVAAICGIPLENIKRNAMNQNHWDIVIDLARGTEPDRSLEIVTDATLSVSDVQAFSAARQYDVIFIDYLQQLHAPGQSEYDRVTNTSMELHRFSQSHSCAVVGLSQLNRGGGESGKHYVPNMSSLRSTGQLEQDADAILFLYLEDDRKPSGRRVLKCAKNKEGERFNMLLDFDGKIQRFSKAADFGRVQREMARMARENKQQERQQQLTLLPNDTPVPF